MKKKSKYRDKEFIFNHFLRDQVADKKITDFDAVTFYKAANHRHLDLNKLIKEHFTN